MALQQPCIALVFLLVASWTTLVPAASPDFQKARNLIHKVSPNINYTSFCLATPGGEDKVACRIKEAPSVGFLVCKKPVYVEDEQQIPCREVIKNELGVLQRLGQNNVTTVTVSPPQIDGVKCGVDASLNCSGFLEGWVKKDEGQFIQVRDKIVNGQVNELINEVENFTQDGALQLTAADLRNIRSFMIVNKSQDEYRQICDLQGFFLKNGGLLVGDIPSIADVNIEGYCWDGEPTTKDVLAAIDAMIEAFTKNAQTNGAATVCNASQPYLLYMYCICHMYVTNMLSIY